MYAHDPRLTATDRFLYGFAWRRFVKDCEEVYKTSGKRILRRGFWDEDVGKLGSWRGNLFELKYLGKSVLVWEIHDCKDSLDVRPMRIKVSEWVWTPIHPSTALVSFCVCLPFHPNSPDNETWCNIVQRREVERRDYRPVKSVIFCPNYSVSNLNF